ncbi:MAG: O-antigen ligase family protein [Candidatus Devosia phytovorans]|uniref:O-antigen ligase family protein n=1 Tax=Candidatus Devosia phytovorans TaxID=3121372 RepID=A0AAJ5VSJ4_9HYPH|nr:O-antigen ligase family protein [Devosia sp.]WEK04031.1 MAG: O-antigen ligase family protein [Devosia sp.]
MQSTISLGLLGPRDRIAAALSAGALLSTLLLWPFLGNGAAYVGLALSIPTIAVGWHTPDWQKLLKSPALWALWGGFVLLAVAFLLQPGWPSISSLVSFSVFALAPVLMLAIAPLSRSVTLQQFALVCIVGAGFAAAVGLYGMSQGEMRVTAPSLSPIHFAALAVTLGFMGLGVTLMSASPWRWLALAGPLLGFVASVASGTRAALVVGCALALLYGLFWMQRRAMPLWQKLLTPIVLAASVLLIFYLASLAGFTRPFDALRATWGSLTGDLGGDVSTAYRLEMYSAGWQAFVHSPWIGHGWRDQLTASMPFLSELGRAGYAAEGWAYIHNDALSFAVAAGIMGFAAYCLFMAAPFLAQRSHGGEGKWSLRAYLAGTFVLGLFVGGATDVLFMVEIPKFALVVVTAVLLFLPADPGRSDV